MRLPRVRYREGQQLVAQDLRDEQAHKLRLARSHRLTMHDWGIVTGLELTVSEDGLSVAPGVAIDGLGRELVLPSPVLISLQTRNQDGTTLLDRLAGPASDDQPRRMGLWLEYRAARGPEPGDSARSCRASPDPRWVEAPRLLFTPRTPEDPREVPARVLLGAVVELNGAVSVDEDQCLPYARLIAGTVTTFSRVQPPPPAGAAQTASTSAVPSVAIDLARRMGGARRRFAIAAPAADGTMHDRLRIDSDGDVMFGGSVRIAPQTAATDVTAGDLALGDDRFSEDDIVDPDGLICRLAAWRHPVANELLAALRRAAAGRLEDLGAQRRTIVSALNILVAGEALYPDGPPAGVALRRDTWDVIRQQPASLRTAHLNKLVLADLLSPYVALSDAKRSGAFGVAFRPVVPAPGQPSPWSLSRVDVAEEGVLTARQLQIEMAAPIVDTAGDTHRVRIGAATAEGEFRPYLTIDAAGNVTVHGDLDVGRLIESPIKPDVDDPRFLDALAGATLQGNASGLAAISTLDVQIPDFQHAARGTEWPYTIVITNTGTATVSGIQVFETVAINGSVSPARLLNDEPHELAAQEQIDVDVTHEDLPETATGSVSVAVTVIGSGPGLPMYGSRIASAPVIDDAS